MTPNIEYNDLRDTLSNRQASRPPSDCEIKVLEIVINGEPRTVPGGLNVLSLLRELGITPDRVAVELNRKIVRQPEWDSTPVNPGAQVEIVQFVGGG